MTNSAHRTVQHSYPIAKKRAWNSPVTEFRFDSEYCFT